MTPIHLPHTQTILDSEIRRARLRRIALGVTVFAMYNTIKNMFEGIRPFDWLMLAVEILVLLLILYGEWASLSERRKKRKREKFLASKRSWLAGVVSEGDQLRRNVPVEAERLDSRPSFEIWIESVNTWSAKTADSLDKECPKATIVFNLTRPLSLNCYVVEMPNSAGRPFPLVSQDVIDAYERLVSQLASLTEITEKAELYF